MGFIYLVLILILLLLVYIFTQTIRFHVLFHLDDELYINILCLYPLIKICIKLEEDKPILMVYIFKIRVYKTLLKMKRRADHGVGLVQSINPRNIYVDTYYGFRNPYTTGILCGALGAASNIVDIKRLHQVPDFLSTNDYVYVKADADIHVGHSIMNFAKMKSKIN